jgi:hypothetical protein
MTIDVYKIPFKAFGLLSEEDREALREHERQGGRLQRFNGYNWISLAEYSSHNCELTYRAAPEPRRPISCTLEGVSIWDLFDESVGAFARDEGGFVVAYLSIPKLGKSAWIGHVAVVFPKCFTAIDPGNMPWDESLILRRASDGVNHGVSEQ